MIIYIVSFIIIYFIYYYFNIRSKTKIIIIKDTDYNYYKN